MFLGALHPCGMLLKSIDFLKGMKRLLEELLSKADRVARGFEDQEIRRSLGEPFGEVLGGEEAMKIAFRSERMLSKSEKLSLGISGWTLGPEWPDLHRRGGETPACDDGHWLRAPFETGKPHTDGLRSRIMELQIGNIAGLLAEYGREIEFWLIQETTPQMQSMDLDPMPRIVLPIEWAEAADLDGVLGRAV